MKNNVLDSYVWWNIGFGIMSLKKYSLSAFLFRFLFNIYGFCLVHNYDYHCKGTTVKHKTLYKFLRMHRRKKILSF